MEQFIRGGAEFQRRFNCSFYNVSDVPLNQRRNVPLGIFWLTIITVQMVVMLKKFFITNSCIGIGTLYAPCVWSIWRQRRHSFYKVMFVMSLLDILCLLGYTMSSIYQISGVVFCSAPTFNFVITCVYYGVYIAETWVEIVLALNRCAYFVAPNMALKYFAEGDPKTWLWNLPPITLGILYGFYGQLFFYSPIKGTAILNHHFGYADQMFELYVDERILLWIIHNWILMIALPAIYIVFAIAILKQRSKKDPNNPVNKMNIKPIFYQIFVISFLNFFNSFDTIFSVYIYNENTNGNVAGALMQFSFMDSPLLYILWNKRIRADCRKFWGKCRKTFFNLVLCGCISGSDSATSQQLASQRRKRQVELLRQRKRDREIRQINKEFFAESKL